MIDEIKRFSHAFRNGNPEQQYLGWIKMTEALGDLYTKLGKFPLHYIDGQGTESSGPTPPPAEFAVAGVDGKFLVSIVNAPNVLAQTPAIARARALASINRSFTPVLHQLQSSFDVNFDNNSTLVDYGVSSQLAYEVQDPNVTRFFRLRSSFDGKNWNPWQIYSSPLTCGPVGVYSGLLRSSANALLNSVAVTANGTSPLTQSGTSTKINVAAASVNAGDQKISYLGGSVDPGSYGQFSVYVLDPKRAGGAVTFLTTQNIGTLGSDNGVANFGQITTSGGGGGTGGGGFGCGIRGSVVDLVNGSRAIEDMKRGDMVLGCDDGPERVERIRMVPHQACFSLATRDVQMRNLWGASFSHKLRRGDGGFVMLQDVMIGDVVRFRGMRTTVMNKRFLGMRSVYQIELSRSKTYFLDGFESHNIKPL